MATGQSAAVLRQIGRLFTLGSVTGLDEGQLLERFVARRDEAAFEAVVARHGPMVLGVCRQVLRDPNDVDDAFQATFLVLVRKAGSLRRRDLLGNWLYGVAYRVALRARASSARRCAIEAQAGRPEVESSEGESRPWLYEEIARLPEKYRVPIVLCYLEGQTHEEAAEHLRWPVGTVKGRLARARDLLRIRLTRRGLSLPAVALIAEWTRDASAAVPLPLIQTTIRAALLLAAGRATTGLISAQVLSLIEGALHTMFLTKVKAAATAAILLVGVAATGEGALALQATGRDADAGPKTGPGSAAPAVKNPARDQAATPPTTTPAARRTGSGAMFKAMGRGMEMGMGMGMGAGQGHMPGQDPQSLAVKNKLAEPIALHFAKATPLKDVLEFIKTSTRDEDGTAIPIYVDRFGLEQAGISLDSPIEIELEGVPLRNTLSLLLAQLHLRYQVVGGIMYIFLANDVTFMNVVQHNSAELLLPGAMLGMGMPGMMAMGGGMGGGAMPGMGGRGEGMMGMMRGAGATDIDDETILLNRAIAEKLNGADLFRSWIEKSPESLTLDDVLKTVRSATGRGGKGIPIYVHPTGLMQAGATMQSPVTFDQEELPPVVALRLMLRTLRLAPTIRDGVLYIDRETSPPAAR